MFSRRNAMGALAGLALAASALPAYAADWKSQYKELTLAVIPVEMASTTADRFQPLADYLSKELGVPVKLNIANDYAAVIEAQRAGNAQIGYHGPASYARAILTNVDIDPLVIPRHSNGLTGYYSVIYTLASSPYKSVDDLKGKKIALVDPNSTSGNNAPRFFLHREGKDVDTFFSQAIFAGSHDNALLALAQGTVDAAANAWNSENDSNLTKLLAKGVLKDANGNPMKKEDFRIVFKSDFLPEGPYAVLASLPADLKAAITQALLDLPKKDKKAFDGLSDGNDLELVKTDAAMFKPIVDMVKFNDEQRKKSS